MAEPALVAAVETLTARVEELARHLAVLSDRVPLPADELSTDEARALYGISRSTLYDLARRELLTIVKREGRRGSWWRRAELETWLRGCPEPRRRGRASREKAEVTGEREPTASERRAAGSLRALQPSGKEPGARRALPGVQGAGADGARSQEGR